MTMLIDIFHARVMNMDCCHMQGNYLHMIHKSTNSWTLNDGKTIYDYEMKNDSFENDSIENMNRYFFIY